MEHSDPRAMMNPDATEASVPGAAPTPSASPAPDTAVSMAACGPALSRALERAAVRDLQASRRETYRAQDKQDCDLIEHLRLERNAKIDRLDEQVREVNTTRELELSAQRAAWINANAIAAEKRRAARVAIREARKHDAPLRHAYLERLRHEHNEQIERLDEELKVLRVTHGLAEAELRETWLAAKERARVAKRTMKAALRELRAQESAERAQRVASEDAERKQRNEASDARWDAARKATTDYAVMQAEMREARRTGTGDLAAMRACEAELRAEAERLEHVARSGDLAAESKAFEQCRASSVGRAMNRASLREEWLSARHEADVERRRARDVVREFRASTKPEMLKAEERIRARRNEVNDRYEQAVNEVYLTWGLSEADMRSEALEAHAHAHELKVIADRANREFLRQGREEEAALLESIRVRRNAAYDAYSQEVLVIRTKRGVARAEEREQARSTAREVYARFRAELAGA